MGNFSRFFIERPIFASVLAIIITLAVITAGLDEGDKVIVDNLVKIRPGTAVEAKPVQPK